jgi:hypothetical protein
MYVRSKKVWSVGCQKKMLGGVVFEVAREKIFFCIIGSVLRKPEVH